MMASVVAHALERHGIDKVLNSKEGEGVIERARSGAEKALTQIHTITGLSWVVVVGLVVLLVFLVALLFDSSEGRGRRYRRGYSVAYREELGKQRARMRAQQELAGVKKPGWRERTGKPRRTGQVSLLRRVLGRLWGNGDPKGSP